jgi:membrane fusion protein (multidrug efflux system)
MLSKKRLLSGAVILCFAVAVLVVMMLPNATRSVEQQNDERVTDVRVLEVVPETLKDWVDLPGSVEPYLATKIAAEVEGRVDWIGPAEGDIIKNSGAPLVRIDQKTLLAQVDEARAAYDLSFDSCARMKELHGEGIIADEQLDECKAKVATDLARLEVARIALEKSTVRAPNAGVLNKCYVEVGEYVRKGDPIADIVVIDPVKVLVKVPEKDIPRFRPGQEQDVSFNFMQGKIYKGAVSYISVVGDPGTRTYNVEITVANPNREILPSMIATVRNLRREIPEAIAVPLLAIIPRGDYLVAFVEKDGKAVERLIEIGIFTGGRAQVVKGIEPHEHLIIEGQRELADGELVRVHEAEGNS